jgi:hypothetical protein
MSPQMRDALLEQHAAFVRKFGREPGPSDPVFFDPDKDVPTPLSMEPEVLAAMQKANLPPEFAYAYKKTGLLGLGSDKSNWPPGHVKEWNDAVAEYRAIEAASKRPGRPDPQVWNTKIPELLISPFSQDDLDQVIECLRAIAPIEARGMKVVTRIELAACLLTAACEHGYESGEETEGRGEGPELFALTEQLVLRRAREIYAQGSA